MSGDGIEQTEDGFRVTLTGRFDRVEGWAEGREDLGLNKGGPDSVDGVEIAEEHEVYYDEEEQEHVAGYEEVVLLFENTDSLRDATDRLYSKATERFEWGMAKEAEKVQDLAGKLPSASEVNRSIDTGTERSRADR